MKKIIISIITIMLILSGMAWAEEAGMEAGQVHAFPELAPEFDISLGYRILDYDDSRRAEEFEYMEENSATVAADIRIFSMPNRLHFDLDVKNKYDYFGDLSYAYKDIVLFRGIHRNVYHNLSNINLDPLLIPANPVDRRDIGEDYDVRVGISDVWLRLKAPDYPLHFFGNVRYIRKEGDKQQRFMGGAAYFFPPPGRVRVSEKREIDWNTTEYTVGVNSHLGPVEAEYAYSHKDFQAGGDDVMYYTYTTGSGRAPGTYPHNQISDLKGYSHTVKLHTAYTGKLVASATLSTKKRENWENDSEADYFVGKGGITYMPWTPLTFFVKYKHSERDVDNQESVGIADISNPSNTYGDPAVRESISSISDRVSVTARYRPFSPLTLRANYTFENQRRSDEEDWHVLEERTDENSYSVAADARIMQGMKLKLKYTYLTFADPSYNIQPDDSHKGKATLSWLIHPRVNTFLSYRITREDREPITHLATGGGEVPFPWQDPVDGEEIDGERDVSNDSFFGTVSFLILKDLSLSTSYAYNFYEVKQDLYYHDHVPQDLFDESTPYQEHVQSYTANINYRLNDLLRLNGGVTYTRSKSEFDVDDFYLTATAPVDAFSELETEEAVYSVGGRYSLRGGFILGADYRYSDFNDVDDNPWDDVEDGDAQIIWLTVTKKWG